MSLLYKFSLTDNRFTNIQLRDMIRKALQNNEQDKLFKYLEELKSQGISTDFIMNPSWSILYEIASLNINDSKKCCILRRLLSEYYFDVNINVNDSGSILVHSVGLVSDPVWYNILINNGADVNSLILNTGCTALDLASSRKMSKLYSFLRGKGAKRSFELSNGNRKI